MGAASAAPNATRLAAPRWAQSSTAVPSSVLQHQPVNQVPAAPPTAADPTAEAAALVVPEAPTAAVTAASTTLAYADAPQPSEYETPEYNRPNWARARPEYVPGPPLNSSDGRVKLTDTTLAVRGQTFLLLELERAELTPVKWILYYLLGGLGLAFVIIAYLQNGLRTMPFAAGLLTTSLLLLYGWRGTNRLRLFRLGREALNFALPGETGPWQQLTGEANRRIRQAHDRAAAEAATLLAAADEAIRQAALAAQAAEQTTESGSPEVGNQLQGGA